MNQLSVTKEVAITLPEGKVAVESLTQRLIDAFVDGTEDPIRLDVQLKALEEVVKAVRGNLTVKHTVMQALSLYPEKTVELYGAQITKKLSPARYDYSVCGDPTYTGLTVQMDDIKAEMKAREAFLKSLKAPITLVDDTTGEVHTVSPPAVEQGETIAVKFV